MSDQQLSPGGVDGSAAPDRPAPVGWSVTGVVLAAGLIGVCVAVGLSAALPASTVLQLAGRSTTEFVALTLPAVKGIVDFAGAVTVGWLIAAVFFAPPAVGGRFDTGGYRSAQAASLAAMVWAVAALALVPLTYASVVGQPLLSSLGADELTRAVSTIDTVRAPLITALLAALVAVLARVVLRPATAAPVLVLAAVAMLPIALAGHAAASSDHDFATDTMIYHLAGISVWVGGLVAFLGLVRQRADHLPLIARRYSVVALVAFVLVAVSGIGNALIRVPRLSDLATTDYGRLVVLKAVLLVALGGFGYLQRRRSVVGLQNGDRRPLLRLAVFEIGVMAATIGVAVALGRTAPPAPLPVVPTDTALVLGYDLSQRPSFATLVLGGRFDLILGTAALVLAALYAWGLVRLHRRGTAWPRVRAVAWFAGCLVMLIATSSGLAVYADAQFSFHMMAHMLLGMLAPILFVLGAPTTLALRALPASRGDGVPGLREGIVGVMHARWLQVLTHPLVVFPLFIGSFYAVYFTSLFDSMISSHTGHLVMNVHFLMVGYLYYWVIIGVDPAPRRLTPLTKLAMLLGALPFHAFFGLALMNTRTVLGQSYFQSLGLPWVDSLLTDQHVGGGIAWGGSEIPLVVVIISLLAQWSKGDEREARRTDRRAELDEDSDLTAYNAMLARFAERDGNRPTPREE
ncbi:cytochrome c oxidase assembly protein [Nakamurella deserti]|uniref:cytochrome c oxidase assembly protein n=1 Tax=Nakamurella deserti TaxID=2164074 RepID=UPI00197B318B|nr:cytochrome c oxidase assembly protein [Nakamurella deserti]